MPTAPCQTGRGRLYAQRSIEILYIDTQRFPLLPFGKRLRRNHRSGKSHPDTVRDRRKCLWKNFSRQSVILSQ